jgi:hypothetical protein
LFFQRFMSAMIKLFQYGKTYQYGFLPEPMPFTYRSKDDPAGEHRATKAREAR